MFRRLLNKYNLSDKLSLVKMSLNKGTLNRVKRQYL